MRARIAVDQDEVARFCQRHKIRMLALFGSVLRDDFQPSSDVDVLVEFEPGARVSLLDLARTQEELGAVLGREVDLLERNALRNPFRRREILRTMEVLYAA